MAFSLDDRITQMKNEAYERSGGDDGLGRIDDNDYEAIKQLIRDVIAEVTPELDWTMTAGGDMSWNKAIHKMEEKSKELLGE